MQQSDFWEPPLAPCLQDLGFVRYGNGTCDQARLLGNEMGKLYDSATDCAQTKSFSTRGDELYSQMGCDKDPNGQGDWGEVQMVVSILVAEMACDSQLVPKDKCDAFFAELGGEDSAGEVGGFDFAACLDLESFGADGFCTFLVGVMM